MWKTKQRKARAVILRRQREVIRDVMLSAGQCATWLTLDELAKLTHYPPASIRRIAPLAKAAERGTYRGETLQNFKQGHARGRLRRRMGILRAARAACTGSESEA